MSIEYINQTLINRWEICPESVRRRWIEGEIIPPGIAARIGTGLHKGAEVNHRAKMATGKDEPLSVIQDAAREGYVESMKDGVFIPLDEAPSAQKQISDGIDTTVALAKLYRESLAPQVMPAFVEEEIYLAHPDLPISFRGTIDVYTVDGWLPDLKSAAKKWPSGKADASVQATLYRELIRERTGEYPKKTSFEVFTKSKKGEHFSFETDRTPEDFALLVKRAKLILWAIQAGIFTPAPADSWACSQKWCGYFFTCPHIPSRKKIIPKDTI